MINRKNIYERPLYALLCTVLWANASQATPPQERVAMSTHNKAAASSALPSAQEVADALKLEGHIEGGFFRRTFQADHRPLLATDSGERFLMTSIYYMLTSQSPIGHWHLNKSDIMHYYQLGDPIEYTLIYPDGKIEKVTMGSDVVAGEQLQLLVKGGVWKSSRLLTGPRKFGLISEAVAPGFDYADMTLGTEEILMKLFPQHKAQILPFVK